MSSPRANIAIALAIALALHALLGVALALYLSHAPAPDELAQLDLTSVDLSFAETIEETSAAAAPASQPPTPPSPVEAAILPPPPVESAILPPPVDTTPPPPPPVEAAILPPPVDTTPTPPPPVDAAPSPRQMAPKLPSPEESPAPLPPVASAPRQARVDAPPKPRCSIRPDYPRESRLRGEHGDVSLELDVAADGSVTAVRVLKSPGYPLLDEAAVKAARAARFTPAQSGGKPVVSTVRFTLNFRLK